ncbi:MAG: LAGLIDADG family homing endonuclease [Candidatus Aenigmatarchaeota archaeon]
MIDDYEKGADIPMLESLYPFSETYIRKILIKRGINIRSLSEQQTIKHHGRLPIIRDGLSEGKLKIIFAMLGDNIGNIRSKGYGIGIIGDLDFIKAFVNIFEKEYGIRPSISKVKNIKAFRAILKNKNIYNDLNKYAQFGVYDWKLLDNTLEFVEKMDPTELGRSVSYFWEAEGCAVIKNKTIEATSVNYNGLKQIQKIMNLLQIKTSITGPNYTASSNGLYTLRVSGLENIKAFREKVNFVTLKKRKEIEKLLNSYKKFVKIHTLEEYKKAFELKNKDFKLKEISSALNISLSTLKTWFYEGIKPCHPSLRARHLS